jgi:hypothetical protein
LIPQNQFIGDEGKCGYLKRASVFAFDRPHALGGVRNLVGSREAQCRVWGLLCTELGICYQAKEQEWGRERRSKRVHVTAN